MELERQLCSRKYKLEHAEVATVRLRLPTKKKRDKISSSDRGLDFGAPGRLSEIPGIC